MTYTPTGISATDKLPGTYVEIRFAQGEGSSANLSRDILLIGDMTADGYATENTQVVLLQNEAEAKHYFGARSEVHRMFREVAKVNKSVRVYAIGLTEATGNKSTGIFTVTGTAVTAGSIEAWVAGNKVTVAFVKGDTATTIGDRLEAQLNAISFLPCTAANVTGTVTLTAALKGTAGNEIRIRCTTTAGSGITCTASGATLTGGTGQSSITTALDTIEASTYYYQVLANTDATNVQAHVAQLKLMAEPSTQVRQVGIFGFVGTSAALATIVQNSAVNCERMQAVHLEKSESMACELAALVAGLRAKYELSDWGYNFNGMPVPAKAPYDTADYPTSNELRTDLESGISPLAVDKFGGVSLVASRTTRNLNGANPDYRASQTYIVSVCDAFAAELQSDLASSFRGKKVSADVDKVLPNVAMPKNMRAKIIKWMKEYTSRPWLAPDKIEDMIASIDCVKSTGTLSAQFSLFCAENLDKVFAIGLESSEPQ